MKKLFYLFAFCPFLLQAQIINTTVGTGTAGYSGDGGLATAAKIRQPSCTVYDAAGNMYLSDYGNHCIRKITTDGVISTYAGTGGSSGYWGDGGPATNARLKHQVKLYMDATDNLYIADAENNCVRKVTPAGIITTVAGTGTAGYSGDGGPATAAQISYAASVTFDASGNMYIADYQNHRVRKVGTDGMISTVAGSGIAGSSGDGGPATAARLNGLFDVKFDAAGNMYIADAANNKIRKVTPAGIITTFAGTGVGTYSGDGGPATAAGLYNPAGIEIDATGTMYIADQMNKRIRKVALDGTITTVAGTGIGGFTGEGGDPLLARINGANSISVNPSGNLVISDVDNHRVRVIASCGTSISTHSGNQSVVQGHNTILYVTTTAASPVFQWQQNMGTGYMNLAASSVFSGVNNDTLQITGVPLTLDNSIYRCIIRSTESGCSDTTMGDTLTVTSNVSITGLDDENQLVVYPNPAQNYVMISGVKGQYMLQLVDELGREVRKVNITGAASLDLQGLRSGIYFLRITSNTGTVIKQICKP